MIDTAAVKELEKAIDSKIKQQPQQNKYKAQVLGSDSNGYTWVNIFGGASRTPVKHVLSAVSPGDIVEVVIENGKATIPGNMSQPSTNNSLAYNSNLSLLGSYFHDILDPVVKSLRADDIHTKRLVADEASIQTLIANDASITELTAQHATIEALAAARADLKEAGIEQAIIDKLTVSNIIGGRADLSQLITEQANIIELHAEDANLDNLIARNATILGLLSGFANISELVASNANIRSLDVGKADIDFANIDAAHIDQAIVRTLFAGTGFFTELAAAEGSYTHQLNATKVDGDAINANSIAADRLYIRGEDGIYYQLNLSALGEPYISSLDPDSQTALQNGLHGDNIIANTITADKIDATSVRAQTALVQALTTAMLRAQSITIGPTTGMHIELNSTGINAELGFYQGQNRVAYVSNNQLNIPYSLVLNEMQLGDWIWAYSADNEFEVGGQGGNFSGNLSLVYAGDYIDETTTPIVT